MLKKEIIIDRIKNRLNIYKKMSVLDKYSIDLYERQLNYYKNEICKKELIIQTNIEKVENIMIVAHPDDETIFGFNELHNTDKNWLLIVCSNSMDGRIGVTRKDIPGLIQMSKDFSFNLVVIEHFDIFEEKIINARVDKKVYNYLKKFLLKQEWNKIITHNKDGEYGHTYHIIVYRMVSNILYNNKVCYKTFKVFDFDDKNNNNYLNVKKIIRKYYLMGGNYLLELKCDKVFTK